MGSSSTGQASSQPDESQPIRRGAELVRVPRLYGATSALNLSTKHQFCLRITLRKTAVSGFGVALSPKNNSDDWRIPRKPCRTIVENTSRSQSGGPRQSRFFTFAQDAG